MAPVEFAPPRPSKGIVPESFDYVVDATCKRIRSIPAEKICPHGVLSGKMCKVKVEVAPTQITPIQFEYDTKPAEIQCPEGFDLITSFCTRIETAKMNFFCPEGTADTGERCAMYTQPQMVCPPNYALEDRTTCVQTVEVPPVTEYTVTYSCQGKECSGHSIRI